MSVRVLAGEGNADGWLIHRALHQRGSRRRLCTATREAHQHQLQDCSSSSSSREMMNNWLLTGARLQHSVLAYVSVEDFLLSHCDAYSERSIYSF